MSSRVLQLKRRHGTPGADLFERHLHAASDREWCVGAIEETTNEANVGFPIERNVEQDEREQILEPGEERLTDHDPRSDGAASAHRFEGVRRVGVMAQGADDVGRMRQLAAAGAAGEDELVTGCG
jgi:hypothetical protein